MTEVFSFGKPMPLANDFKDANEPREGCVPVEILWCQACCLAQTSAVVAPGRLYAKYCYVTSTSETMRQHFFSLWQSIKDQGKYDNVLEIGSNDGTLLAFARENGAVSIAGIDPAENLATVAIRNGIPTIIGILDDYTAEIVHGVIPQADVIVARHVFAHVDNWHGFIRNLDTLANVDTLIAIEVPYLVDTLERVELDQLYLEHLSYVSVKAMAALLDGTPFRIQKVMRFPIHGGSIVIFLRRRDNPVYPDASVGEFLDAENITAQTWEDFRNYANTSINLLTFKIRELVNQGKTVCGFGASAKSTVWISACGFSQKEIKFICDCTPNKQGKFSPGKEIPIVPESELMKRRPDYCIIWAWNYATEIIARNQSYLDAGGHFIIPGKKIEIV
jgi:hypothetical protein